MHACRGFFIFHVIFSDQNVSLRPRTIMSRRVLDYTGSRTGRSIHRRQLCRSGFFPISLCARIHTFSIIIFSSFFSSSLSLAPSNFFSYTVGGPLRCDDTIRRTRIYTKRNTTRVVYIHNRYTHTIRAHTVYGIYRTMGI